MSLSRQETLLIAAREEERVVGGGRERGVKEKERARLYMVWL